MKKNIDPVILKLSGDFVKQLEELKSALGAKDEAEVIKHGISLLSYAMGRELKFERKSTNQTLVFDQFKSKRPLVE